ncbi:MAG: zinc-binding dehydrogenase [Pseudomonadota bacterium]
MKAWILEKPGGAFTLQDVAEPVLRPGSVHVEMKATPLLSYLGRYLRGEMSYWYPDKPFTPGTNGVGVVKAVGDGVYHLAAGQRVIVNPYVAAQEPVRDPAQALIGLTGISADSGKMWADWTNGTLRQVADFPASTVVPADGLEAVDDARLATTGKFIVPLGGLMRGRLAAGESVIVHGATGYFGSAAVILAVAMGAERVVAAGRNEAALAGLRDQLGTRVATVRMTGTPDADIEALKAASGGGADLVFDMVGGAGSADGTLSSMRSLRRGGRLVLMGSMEVPVPLDYGEIMLNNWEVLGNFMYPPAAYRTLLALIRSGQLDLGTISLRTFGMGDLDAAIDAAAQMAGLDATVVTL